MAPTKKKSRIEKARHYLSGGAVFREDSDDELGYEDLPWEWIYETTNETVGTQNAIPRKRKAAPAAPEKNIVGARMGSFVCKLGDAVLLKAEGNQAWVGLICEFFDDEIEEEKMARFMWFSSEREIRNNGRKRVDFLPVSQASHWFVSPS
jgi:origin recognition complex subunit 1